MGLTLDTKFQREFIEKNNLWARHPAQMVRDLFGIEPDQWQEEALEAFPHSPQLAMKACAGPGKTAVLAWIGWNFMLTRYQPKIGVTSINAQNLKSGLWAELARWKQKSPLLEAMFDTTTTEIKSKNMPDTWRMEVRTWAKDADATQIGNALRGLHAPYVMWLVDESGDFPDSILPILQNIFAGSPKEAHVVQAGNPTRLSGPLYTAFKNQGAWKVIQITGDPDDPRRSPRISIEHARAQIKQYGRDNPWVMVNILGEFPLESFNALFGADELQRAMEMKYQQADIDRSPRLLGVDVAYMGDDASVIFPRQGLVAFPPKVMRNVDSVAGAGQVARTWDQWQADAVFVDNTGGYGAGWIDQLRVMNREAIGIGFAERAVDSRYFNRRAEMYFNLRDWVKAGGCLPNDQDLIRELTAITYVPRAGKMLLEPKEIIKAKLSGHSPDKSDALALTFAEPVASRAMAAVMPAWAGRQREETYDAFEAAYRL